MSPSILLIHPLGHEAIPVDPAPGRPTVVLVDMLEEHWRWLQWPGRLAPWDRASFLRFQAPDWHAVLLRSWFGGPAKSVALQSLDHPPTLRRLLDLADQGMRIVGVWSLSTAMMAWPALRRQRHYLAVLPLAHGARLIYVRDGLLRFTRLLTAVDPDMLLAEVQQTQRYLLERQIIPLGQSAPPWRWLGPLPPGAATMGLGAAQELPTPAGGWVLALGQRLAGKPGQLAPLELRRHHVAARVRTGLHVAGSCLLAGMLGTVALQQFRDIGPIASQQDQIIARTRAVQSDIAALQARIDAANLPLELAQAIVNLQAHWQTAPPPPQQAMRLAADWLHPVQTRLEVQKLAWGASTCSPAAEQGGRGSAAAAVQAAPPAARPAAAGGGAQAATSSSPTWQMLIEHGWRSNSATARLQSVQALTDASGARGWRLLQAPSAVAVANSARAGSGGSGASTSSSSTVTWCLEPSAATSASVAARLP